MSNEQLKTTLKDLHRHLETAGAGVDPELRNLLQVLDSDIHQLLRQETLTAEETAKTPASEDQGALGSRAQELAARFAAQHPQLETTLRQLGITLESMGI
jgi:hypothetical protein